MRYALAVAVFLAVLAGCCRPDPCRAYRERAERSVPYHQPQK